MTDVIRQLHNVLSILVNILTDIGHAQQLLDSWPHLHHHQFPEAGAVISSCNLSSVLLRPGIYLRAMQARGVCLQVSDMALVYAWFVTAVEPNLPEVYQHSTQACECCQLLR